MTQTMKNIAAVLIMSMLFLSRCQVPEQIPLQATELRIGFVPVHPGGETLTKAVKSGWEKGDAVFVFFEDVTTGYLEMVYDGATWNSQTKGISVTDLQAGGKTLTALFLPFGSDASASYDGTDNGWRFDKSCFAYFLYAERIAYTIDFSGGTATLSAGGGALEMNIPEGFVQFFVEDISAADGFASLSEAGLTPMGIDMVAANGTLSTTLLAEGDDMPGYVYKGGYLFSGILNPERAGSASDYSFILTRDNETLTATASGKRLNTSGTSGRAANITKLSWSVTPPEESVIIVVAPGGNDLAAGTMDRPLKSVAKALEKLAASESASTILLRGGTYEEKVDIRLSGRAGKPIVIKACAGEYPVFDGGGGRGVPDYLSDMEVDRCRHMDYFQSVQLSGELAAMYNDAQAYGGQIRIKGSYIILDGITVTGSRQAGIWCYGGASHLIIRNCNVQHCLAPGICFGADITQTHPSSPSSDIHIIGNHVVNCAQMSREAISLRTVDRFEVAYNTVEDVIKESIDAKGGCTNGSIHHNHIVNSGHVAIYLDAGFADVGIEQKNIDVHANIIENPFGTAICVASESGNDISGINIFNNLAYSHRNKNWPDDAAANTGAGIKIAKNSDDVSGAIRDICIYNNTIYNFSQQGIYVNYPGQRLENIVIVHNISAQNASQISIKTPDIDIAKIRIDRNLIFGAASHPGTRSLSGNPFFTDADGGDFTPMPNSPAIDAIPRAEYLFCPGNDLSGNIRPAGEGFDAGAYEFKP